MRGNSHSGEAMPAMTSFADKILTKAEFLSFCENLRRLDSFQSHWNFKNVRLFEDANRLLLAPDELRSVPSLLDDCHRIFQGESTFLVESGLEADPVSFLKNAEAGFFDGSLISGCACVIQISFPIGNYQISLTFRQKSGVGKKASYEIDWFFGGTYMQDFHAVSLRRKMMEKTLEKSRQKMVEFSEARQIEVEAHMPFLGSIKYRTSTDLRSSRGYDAKELWQGVRNWLENDGDGTRVAVKCLVFPTSHGEGVTRPAASIAAFLKNNGFTTASTNLGLCKLWFDDPTNALKQYHEWLGEMAGHETLSGRAAIFTLGCLNGFDNLVRAYVVPAGMVVGYHNQLRKSPRAPQDLTALIPDAVWEYGAFPADAGCAHPVRDHSGERREEVAEGVAQSVDELLKNIKSFKMPRAKAVLSGSLEDQIHQLGEIGFPLGREVRIRDALCRQSREWYEDRPYTNTLKFMGNWDDGETCPRLWHLDLENPPDSEPYGFIISIVQHLADYQIVFDAYSLHRKGEAGNGVVMKFAVNGTPFNWDIEDVDRWFDWRYLHWLDEILVNHGGGMRLHQSRLEDGSLVIAALTPEEAVKLNLLCPSQFEFLA